MSKTIPPLIAPKAPASVPPKLTPPTTAPGQSAFISGKGASTEKPTGKSGK
jgi:hypothetical protein